MHSNSVGALFFSRGNFCLKTERSVQFRSFNHRATLEAPTIGEAASCRFHSHPPPGVCAESHSSLDTKPMPTDMATEVATSLK